VTARRAQTRSIGCQCVAAHGLPLGWTLRKIVLKSAIPGIVTGLLVALAVGYLTYPIWTFYNLPSKTARDLSYDAAFLLIVFVFLLILLGRLITWFARRHSESA